MSAESFPDDLVSENLHLVQIIARQLHVRLPGHVEYDDLVQWGHLGLMSAAKRFDGSRGNKFSAFATWRIRGAMLDGLRDQDITSRSTSDVRKRVEAAKSDFAQAHGRQPKAEELAKTLRIELEELQQVELRIHPFKNISIDEVDLFTAEDRIALLFSAQNRGDDLVSKIDAMQKLRRIVGGQPPIDRACFMLFYVWGFKMTEIADCFGCTESRISQRIARIHLDGK